MILRVSGFDTIFQSAKSAHHKQRMSAGTQTEEYNFCSPSIYTSTQGYRIYLKLFPFGCASAKGKFLSIFASLAPGEYDAILEWPFSSVIELSVLNQQNPFDKWTQSIMPEDRTNRCFNQGNMSVGIHHFMPHR